MADERSHQARRGQIALAFDNALGEARDRDARVRRPTSRTRTHGQRRVVRVVPRLPELGARFERNGPSEITCAHIRRYLADRFRLLGHVALAETVKLEEQRWRHGV